MKGKMINHKTLPTLRFFGIKVYNYYHSVTSR
jgi:hypothetical protein